MKQIYQLLIISCLLVFSGCENSEKQSNASEDIKEDSRIVISKEQFKANNMKLGRMETREFPVSISVNGMIDVPPENKATVNAIKGGYIRTIPLLIGDKVKKGQVLLTIENPEFVEMQQDYLEVKEQLDYLKSEFDRQHTMFKENIISQKVYLKAESEYKTAAARYSGLRKQLSLLNISPTRAEQGNITSIVNIYAPISGSITKVHVSKGTYVSPSTPIMELIDNSHIHLELSVFEKDIMHIQKNQNIQFNIPEASNETYEAKVYLVGTSIEDNRTITVHAHPLDDSHQFLTGMFVNAKITTDITTSKALPQNAFVENEDNYYVLTLDEESESNYYFKQLKVESGNTIDGYTEITGLELENDDTSFLTDGAFGLIGIE